MANQYYLDLILDDVFTWNKWRRSQAKDLTIDLSNADFTKGLVDISGADLHKVCLRCAVLDLAYLSGVNCCDSDFTSPWRSK
jgi:uncharacterized protein YjbI with pentapeptide repeats